MKLYRVQANYKNIYINEMLEAENDKAALRVLLRRLTQRCKQKEGRDFYDPDFFVTFEEGWQGDTNWYRKLRWVQVGNRRWSGRVTPDMKWIDIKIKNLKTKINDQSVEDAGLDYTIKLAK